MQIYEINKHGTKFYQDPPDELQVYCVCPNCGERTYYKKSFKNGKYKIHSIARNSIGVCSVCAILEKKHKVKLNDIWKTVNGTPVSVYRMGQDDFMVSYRCKNCGEIKNLRIHRKDINAILGAIRICKKCSMVRSNNYSEFYRLGVEKVAEPKWKVIYNGVLCRYVARKEELDEILAMKLRPDLLKIEAI